jgi:hypothetical protein
MRSIKEHPREVWILYVTPYDIFDAEPSLETVKTGEYKYGNHPYCLYRTRREGLRKPDKRPSAV